MPFLLAYVASAVLTALWFAFMAGRSGGAGLFATPLQSLLVGALWPLTMAMLLGEASRNGRPRIVDPGEQRTFEGGEP
jgi:hypothetical protein